MKVLVKWGKQKLETEFEFDDDKISRANSADALKRKIYALTGVPVERQKLMCKGAWKGTLKSTTDMHTLSAITAPLKVTLVGRATQIPEAPVLIPDRPTFEEDLDPTIRPPPTGIV